MTDTRLNIVWFVADHVAFGNRLPLAAHGPLQTRLSSEGVTFTEARTVLPVCSPARASMLTGLYPHAHGLTENDGRFGGRPGLNPTDWTIGTALRDGGYRCGWFGKWHVDNEADAGAHGFEGFSLPGYGYPYGTAAYGEYLRDTDLPDPVVEIEQSGESGLVPGTRITLTDADDWFDYEAGSATLMAPPETHEAFFVANRAARWIESTADAPFFLRIDAWGPHPPYITAAPFHDSLGPDSLPVAPMPDWNQRPGHHADYWRYWHDTLRVDDAGWRLMTQRALEHAAMVEAAFVSVLEALTARGVADNTLVLFTADHGDAIGSMGGLANKGGLLTEETLRIPLLMRGPGLPAGSRRSDLVTNMDLAATCLEAAGLTLPPNRHARSLMAAARGGPTVRPDGLMTQHNGLHVHAPQRAFHADGWKLVCQGDGFTELYDLATDPFECRNLASDPVHADRLARLRNGLAAVMAETGDTFSLP